MTTITPTRKKVVRGLLAFAGVMISIHLLSDIGLSMLQRVAMIGTFVLLAGVYWSDKLLTLARNFGGVTNVQPVRGLLLGFLIVGFYILLGSLAYIYLFPWLQTQVPFASRRLLWFVVVLTYLGSYLALIRAIRVTGFPIDPYNMAMARRGLILVTVAMFAFVIWMDPRGQLFDQETGEPIVMMEPVGNHDIYFHLSPEDCEEGCYSGGLGDRLVPVTREVALTAGVDIRDLSLSDLFGAEAEPVVAVVDRCAEETRHTILPDETIHASLLDGCPGMSWQTTSGNPLMALVVNGTGGIQTFNWVTGANGPTYSGVPLNLSITNEGTHPATVWTWSK